MKTYSKIPPEKRVFDRFTHQRIEVIPANIRAHYHELPMVGQLHITHIGTQLKTMYYHIERSEGSPQTILLYCLDGHAGLQLGQTAFKMKQGHVAIIPANEPHAYYADLEDPWSFFWIHFDGSQSKPVLESLGINAHNPLLYVPDVPMMREAFEDVYACLNYHYSDAGLLSMTAELMRLLSKIKLHCSNPHKQRQATENRVVETIDFMKRHLDIPLSLKDLAAQSGHSVNSYGMKFKHRTGQTPMAFFIQLKINKACKLLNHTDMNIVAIAEELGHNDPYYFSRLFKKVQGCSPAHYRASIKS